MTQDLRVAMTASLNDRLVAPLGRALDEVEKNLKDVQGSLKNTQRESASASRTLSGMLGPARAARQVAELARNTENAVSLAKRLERAWNATGNVVRGVSQGLAAYQAAKYVLREPVHRAVDYQKQLVDAANIAYPAGAQREAGLKKMDSAVVNAVTTGGGTREAALAAMQTMFAANIDEKDVQKLLPTMQKYSTVGNADPKNIADLVIFGLRSLKLPADQIPLMLDKTLSSTKLGSMEFDSLAKWMPQVGAAGGAAGLTGMKGYEQMLAAIQVSRLTAGTTDEGGTNLKDLLSLINGHALKTAGTRMGIDVAGSIAQHIGKGGNALSGVVALADYVASRDPRFAALDKKMKASNVQRDRTGRPIYSPEQEDIIRQQELLFQGSSLGQLFHNQQSMQALVALRNNRDYFKTLLAGTGSATGQIGQQDFDFMKDKPFFQMQQKANAELIAQTSALSGANNALGRFSQWLADVYKKYPELAADIEALKLAVGAAAAGIGAFAGLGWLMKRGGVGGGESPAGGSGISGALNEEFRQMRQKIGGVAAEAGALAEGGASSVGSIARAGSRFGLLAAASGLFFTSDEEMATLKAADARKYHRGAGFDDPRRLDRPADGASSTGDGERVVKAIEDLGKRPIKVYLDGREISSQVEEYVTFKARRN